MFSALCIFARLCEHKSIETFLRIHCGCVYCNIIMKNPYAHSNRIHNINIDHILNMIYCEQEWLTVRYLQTYKLHIWAKWRKGKGGGRVNWRTSVTGNMMTSGMPWKNWTSQQMTWSDNSRNENKESKGVDELMTTFVVCCCPGAVRPSASVKANLDGLQYRIYEFEYVYVHLHTAQ